MLDIASILEELVMSMVAEKKSFFRINKAGIALLLFSILLAVIGVVFSVLALDKYLERTYPPDIAAIGSAIVIFAVSFLAIILRRFTGPKKQLPQRPPANGQDGNPYELIKEICNEFEDPIRENPKMAVLMAAAAGMLMGKNGLRL